MMGKIEGKRRREQQRMRWLGSITDSMDMNLSKLQEIGKTGVLQPMGLQKVRHDLVIEQQTTCPIPENGSIDLRRSLAALTLLANCCGSVTKLRPTLCNCGLPGSCVVHCLLEFVQIEVH